MNGIAAWRFAWKREGLGIMLDTTAHNRRSLGRKLLICIAIVFAVVMLLLIGLYFAIISPAFFNGIVLPRAEEALNSEITVGQAQIQPFSGLALRQLKLQPRNAEPLIQAQEARIRYDWTSFIRGRPQIHELSLVAPIIQLVLQPDGTSNLDPLLRALKEKTDKTKKAKEPSEPPQLNLQNISLQNATIRRLEIQANGATNIVELTGLNLTLDQLANGQEGKLTIASQVKMQNDAPGSAGADLLRAKMEGTFKMALNQNLLPSALKGSSRLEVLQTEGGFQELSRLSANLDCDFTPTEMRQVALQFQQNQTNRGAVRVQGPFDLSKREAHLTLALISIDRHALNLLGAAKGWEFKQATLNGTNQIDLSNNGAALAAKGTLTGTQISLKHDEIATPPLDLQLVYEFALDQTQKVLRLRQLFLGLTPTSQAKNEIQLQGKIDLKTNGAPSRVALRAESIDLTHYYNLFVAKTDARPASQPQETAAPAPPKQQTEPEPLPLPVEDLTVDLQIGRFQLRDLQIHNWHAQAKLQKGQLTLSPFAFRLYQAPVSADARVNLAVPGYTYDLSLRADKVPLEPILNTFSAESRGRYQGDLIAQAQLKGAGVTGRNLRKNLAGDLHLLLTNVNVQLLGPKVRNVLVPIAVLLRVPELTESPFNWLNARAHIANGQIQINEFKVLSEAFYAKSQGTIPLAEGWTNSPLNMPIEFSLRRSLAERANLVPPESPTNTAYVPLPQFARLSGSIGNPRTETDKFVISGLLMRSASRIPGVSDKAGQLLEGLGGILSRLGLPNLNPNRNRGTNATAGTNQRPKINK